MKPGFTLVAINISTFSAQEASPRTQSLMAQLSTQEDTRPQVHALPTANPTTAIPESWEQPSRGTMDTEKTDLDSSTDFFGFKRKDPDAVQDSPAINRKGFVHFAKNVVMLTGYRRKDKYHCVCYHQRCL